MPEFARRIAFLVFWSTLALPPLAQDPTRFYPNKELPGFAACDESEFRDLYETAQFTRKEGQVLTADEVAQLRRSWNEVKGRGDARVALIRSSPTERSLYELENKIRAHRFLGRIDFQRVDAHAPFYYYVEPPPKDDPSYGKQVADGYGEWFQELGRVFDSEYVRAGPLARRADYLAFAVFVLRSRGTYTDFADALESPGLYSARAHYDPELRIVVTHQDYFGSSGESKTDDRRAALHELVHVLQHAHHAERDRMPRSVFFNEGLADYLSFHDGVVPKVLTAHQVDESALGFFANLPSHQLLECLLFPLTELIALENYGVVAAHAQRRARELGLGDLPGQLAIAAVYAQSSLWMHYLHHGENGLHRPRVVRYIVSVLSGTSDREAFDQAFQGVELERLDRGFRTFLRSAIERELRTSIPIPRDARPLGRGADPAAGSPQPAAASRADVPLSASELAPDATGPEAEYVQALSSAVQGQFAEASRALRALGERTSGPLGERVRTELERVDAYRAERVRFLRHLEARGKKLNLKKAALKLLAKVEEVGETEVRLGKNTAGIERLALDDIDAVALAEAMGQRELGFAPSWAAAYPYVLRGDPSWKKLLDGGSAQALAMRADAESGLAGFRAEALATAELLELSRMTLPPVPTAAQGVLERIRALIAAHGATGVVKARRPALRRLAVEVLKPMFADAGLGSVLAGKCEPLPKGCHRLTYDFSSEKQLEDFPLRGYLSSRAHVAEGGWSVQHDTLLGNGFASLRHAVEFQGPLTLRARARYVSSAPAGYVFLLGFNDDGLGNYASIALDGSLSVVDQPRGYLPHAPAEFVLRINEWYELEVRYDGESRAESFVNGRRMTEIAVGPRKAGGVFLFTSSHMLLEVTELVITGTVSEAGRASLRDAWIAERLVATGL